MKKKKSDITLVHMGLPFPLAKKGILNKPPPLGILYIAFELERNGYAVEARDYQLMMNNDYWSIQNFIDSMLKDSADVVGFSCMIGMLPFLLWALSEARKVYPDKTFMIGGSAVTNVGRQIIDQFPFLDAVVMGEGEESIVEMMRGLAGRKWESIEGIGFRKDGKVLINGVRKRIDDLDRFGDPAYHLVPMEQYYYCNVISARGCVFNCSFCEAPALWQRKIKFRSIERVLDEVEYLNKKYNKHYINICDDSFLASESRVSEFCKGLISREIDIEWDCFARLEQLSPSIMNEMSNSGCRGVFIGIETGSGNVAKHLNKRSDIKIASDVVSRAVKYFPRVTVSLIWGFPFETLDDFKQTVDNCYELAKLGAKVQRPILSLRPGTELYGQYKDQLVYDETFPIHLAERPLSDMPVKVRELIKGHNEVFAGFYGVQHDSLDEKLKFAREVGLC